MVPEWFCGPAAVPNHSPIERFQRFPLTGGEPQNHSDRDWAKGTGVMRGRAS